MKNYRKSFQKYADTMREILSFFRKYNFTIDENDQDSYISVEDEELQAQLFDQLLELMDQEDEED